MSYIDSGGCLPVRGLQQENSYYRQKYQELLHRYLHDNLTGLPNRILFTEHLNKAYYRYQRDRKNLFAVLFVDLDRFKMINDTWGHKVGDRVLKSVASTFQESCRLVDTIARLGGDEFTILLEDLSNEEDAITIVNRILARSIKPIYIKDRTIIPGISIGIAFSAERYHNGAEILHNADLAMYRAKASGGGYAIYKQ